MIYFRSLTDDRLNHLLVTAPERSIILLEDIDAAFADDEAARRMSNQYINCVTFSGYYLYWYFTSIKDYSMLWME